MAIRGLRQRADELAAEAGRLRRARNAHAARAIAIVRARISTPAGLALCFAAGIVVGRPSSRAGAPAERKARHAATEGAAGRLLGGPLAAAAVRLASAFVTGAAVGGPPRGT